MGMNALIAALLCMTLPETRNQPTLETIETEEGKKKMNEMWIKEDDKGLLEDSRL